MTWGVRPGRRADLAALPNVERAAARLFPPGRVPDPDLAHDVEELEGYLLDGILYVAEEAAEEGARPVGFVIARPLEGALHVFELAVAPEAGRRGIGTELMRRTLADAADQRFPRVTLTTFQDLPWNAPFYERLGFRVITRDELSTPLRRLLDIEAGLGMTHRVAMVYNPRPS